MAIFSDRKLPFKHFSLLIWQEVISINNGAGLKAPKEKASSIYFQIKVDLQFKQWTIMGCWKSIMMKGLLWTKTWANNIINKLCCPLKLRKSHIFIESIKCYSGVSLNISIMFYFPTVSAKFDINSKAEFKVKFLKNTRKQKILF